MIVGIDPGFSGAIALLDPNSGQLVLHDMPVAPSPSGKTETDLFSLGRILLPNQGIRCVAVLEQVAAMPKQGVSSMFRFGQNFGAIQMAIVGHGYEIHQVTPAVWKKYFKLSREKGASRTLASRRFPANAQDFIRVKDDGRAEAALLALWGLETLTQTRTTA